MMKSLKIYQKASVKFLIIYQIRIHILMKIIKFRIFSALQTELDTAKAKFKAGKQNNVNEFTL